MKIKIDNLNLSYDIKPMQGKGFEDVFTGKFLFFLKFNIRFYKKYKKNS